MFQVIETGRLVTACHTSNFQNIEYVSALSENMNATQAISR